MLLKWFSQIQSHHFVGMYLSIIKTNSNNYIYLNTFKFKLMLLLFPSTYNRMKQLRLCRQFLIFICGIPSDIIKKELSIWYQYFQDYDFAKENFKEMSCYSKHR